MNEWVSEVSPVWFFRIGTLMSNSGAEVCLETFVNVTRPPHLVDSREFPFTLPPPASLGAWGPGDCPPPHTHTVASSLPPRSHCIFFLWHE